MKSNFKQLSSNVDEDKSQKKEIEKINDYKDEEKENIQVDINQKQEEEVN